MSAFTIYPAIDLRFGQVVRLAQGDPERQTVYGSEPSAYAQRWINAGASWLHIVNLDGAFEQSDQRNRVALKSILAESTKFSSPISVQFGGGLRSPGAIRDAFNMGVRRVVLGTIGIQKPELLAQLIEEHGPGRLAVSIDVYQGVVKVRGWQHESGRDPLQLAIELMQIGVQTIIYSDIARDGLGTGVDVKAAQNLAQAAGVQVILAGGVDSVNDIKLARQAGLGGVIIGRALYEGKFTLEEALAC